MWPRGKVTHDCAEQVVDALGGVLAGGERLHDLEQRAHAPLQDSLVEGLLAREVVVEAGRGQLGLPRDVANGGAGEAARGKERLGDVQDPITGPGLVRSGRARLARGVRHDG